VQAVSAEAFHPGIRLLKILVEPSIRASFVSAAFHRFVWTSNMGEFAKQ
jgi:hypothetical protein